MAKRRKEVAGKRVKSDKHLKSCYQRGIEKVNRAAIFYFSPLLHFILSVTLLVFKISEKHVSEAKSADFFKVMTVCAL